MKVILISSARSARLRRHRRVRGKVRGNGSRPRLCVFRSANHIYAQVIDDVRGHTLASAHSNEPEMRQTQASLPKTGVAKMVGLALAGRAKAKGIGQVVFDRGGYLYHGRVKALAEGVREGGLLF